MDLELDETQASLVALAQDVLSREAGAGRAREVLAGPGYDERLAATLAKTDLVDLASDPDAGPLAAALVVEQVAGHLGTLDIGAQALVLPALGVNIAGPVALATTTEGRLRFGGQARIALLVEGDEAHLADVVTVKEDLRNFGYPVAQVVLEKREELPAGAGDTAIRWWRVALATEIAGLAEAALKLTRNHLVDRDAFGRPIGSFQAVQHRLATVYFGIESVRWLARIAAYDDAEPRAAATAATMAATVARDAIWELHQLTGALGFTIEYDLQLLTMRMHILRLELDGAAGGHARALADMLWFGAGTCADGD